MIPQVLLYRPPARHHMTIFPQKTVPMALLSMAGYLRERGAAELLIVDGFEGVSLEQLVQQAEAFQPQLLLITGLTAHAYDAMAAATMVRAALPETLICAGGIHFGAVPEDSLRLCEALDLIALGEGEELVLELCQALGDEGRSPDWRERLRAVRGLAWLEGEGPPLDESLRPNSSRPLHLTGPRPLMKDLAALSLPAFDLIQPKRYRMRPYRWRDFVMLESSRGCPFRCTYCHTTQFWQSRWRPKPVERVLDEVQYVTEKLGKSAVHFSDDSWGTRRDRTIEFCEGILSRGLKVDLWAQCRVDDLWRDRDLFPLMRRAGFYGFLIGFESGEQDCLDRWEKGVEAQKALALAPELHRHFDSILGTFFIGDWESNERTFERTWEFAQRLEVDIFAQAPLNLFPPTIPLWREYQERGIEPCWDYDLLGTTQSILPTGSLSAEEVRALHQQSMAAFYMSPRRLLHAARSGRHAWRQFTSQYFALAEDRLRQSARAAVPAHLRGRGRVLRAGFKRRHQRYMEG